MCTTRMYLLSYFHKLNMHVRTYVDAIMYVCVYTYYCVCLCVCVTACCGPTAFCFMYMQCVLMYVSPAAIYFLWLYVR